MKHRDLGTVRGGTAHFWHQRLSGIANFFLGAALLLSLTFYGRGDHADVLTWFAQPWMAAIAMAFIVSATWHMRLGANVVIDDYITTEGLRLFFHLLNIFITLAVMLVGILAMLQILFGDVAPVSSLPDDPTNSYQTPNDQSAYEQTPDERAPETRVPETRVPETLVPQAQTP